MEKITSRKNPLITHIRKLSTDRSYRRTCGEFLGDGVKLLEEAVRWNAPLTCVVVTEGTAVPPMPEGVRVVEVPEYDKCACCGVHVTQTGEIGLIKLFSCVKFHQGVRIEMACGRRALAFLSQVYEENRQTRESFLSRLFR